MISTFHHWAVIIACGVLAAVPAYATDPIPTPIRHQIERSRPTRIDIPMKRGESIDVQLQYLDYAAPVDLTDVQTLAFVLTSGSVTSAYPARVIEATNGMVGFLLTPTNLWVANSYTWELPISGPSHTMIRAYGTLSVSGSISYQNLTNSPPPMETLDFATTMLYNIGLSPWATYAWITNYVGAHGGGFVDWTDIQNRPSLYTQAEVNSLYSNLVGRIDGIATNQSGGGGGGGGTNIIISQTSVTVTNLTISQGGTNINLYSAEDPSKWPTNQPFVTAFAWTNAGSNYTMTNGGLITAVINTNGGSGGLASMPATWDADQIGTNALYIAAGGRVMERHDTNGITLLRGSLQMYEEDLTCNVRLYGGTRIAPSLTFWGQTDEWGLYGRGYGNHYIAGWSVGGTEIGLLHGMGITLMSTNFYFSGTHIGDISGATGYPEPLFTSWRSNMSFSVLNLNNLTISPGGLTVMDANNTPRILATNGVLTVRDAGNSARVVMDTGVTIKDSLGRTISSHGYGLTTYEPASGLAYLKIGENTTGRDTIRCEWSGIPSFQLDPVSGLRLWDPFQGTFRVLHSYSTFLMQDNTSNLIFAVDGTVPTNNIIAARNIKMTNSAAIVFFGGPGGSNLLSTISGTNGGLVVNNKVMLSTNYPTFNLTNVFGGITSVLWFANGIVTNKTP